MLNHTKKVKEIYEDIQRKLFYMIPEKWEKLYLYSSVIDMPKKVQNGELFFYYIPKGIFKKNPVNVYEIPSKFNLEDNTSEDIGLLFSPDVNEYLEKLPKKTRKIAILISDGYMPCDIIEKLDMGKEEYQIHMDIIRTYEYRKSMEWRYM